MLYILEGPRSSGKTTAVKRIQDAFGGRAQVIKFHRTQHPPLFMTEFLAKHYLALIDSRSICVLDRFHLTEFVMRTLDNKVDGQVLYTTTHMIDIMLKHCGAVTYVLDSSQAVRRSRAKLRDADHAKPEWHSYDELDHVWGIAKDAFHISHVKVWPSNTLEDIDKLTLDIMKHQAGGKLLSSQISALPPLIREEQPIEEPA